MKVYIKSCIQLMLDNKNNVPHAGTPQCTCAVVSE